MECEPHLTLGLSDAGFVPRARKVHTAFLDLDIGAHIVFGVVRFQGIQTARVSDTFTHPL